MHLSTKAWQTGIICALLICQQKSISVPDYAAAYSNVSVILGFQRFSAIGKDRRGLPIVYAITVPNSAPHPELAREFLRYGHYDDKGRGQRMAIPVVMVSERILRTSRPARCPHVI